MPGQPTLALDISSRATGWAVRGAFDEPAYGLWLMPGIAERGALYASLRNALEPLLEQYQPRRAVFAPALFGLRQSASRHLAGLHAVAELVCFDAGVPIREITDTNARRLVLGTAHFGKRDSKGSLIKGTGTAPAKTAAVAWCNSHGWRPQSHDVADALVLLEADRMRAN